MKSLNYVLSLFILAAFVSCNEVKKESNSENTVAAVESSRFDELANLPFVENRPTRETTQTLKDELYFQRATQAYLWAMPLINTLGMKYGSEKIFGEG